MEDETERQRLASVRSLAREFIDTIDKEEVNGEAADTILDDLIDAYTDAEEDDEE